MITDQRELDDLGYKAWICSLQAALLAARYHAGLSQAAVAQKAGIAISVVQDMEAGRLDSTRLRAVADYAAACGCAPLNVALMQKRMVPDAPAPTASPGTTPTAGQQDDAALSLGANATQEAGL